MKAFNVNMNSVIKFSAKLERINRSAFPIAVRQTLNDAAFKTKQMVPKVAAQKFTSRQKNFFKAFTIVNKARGYDVNNMMAATGINTSKGSKVAKGLEAQETGGTAEGRKLIAHDKARISSSYGKKIKTKNRFKNLNISTTKNRKAGSKHILIKKGGKGTVFEIKKLKTRTKLTPIYTYTRTKKVNLKKSPFIKPSAMFARSLMPKYYAKNAEYQFKRVLK